MDFAILPSCSNLSDVLSRCIASHRVNAPVFLRMASQRSGSSSPSCGDHYNNETAGASYWLPRSWKMDGNLGLRAKDAAPRSNAPRDSGRPKRVRTRQEARLGFPALLPVAMQRREGADPSLTNQTCSLRPTPACCTFASLAFRILQTPLRDQPAQVSVGIASAPFLGGLRRVRNYPPGQAY